MNKVKRLFLKILQNKIVLDDQIVPAIIKDYWVDMTPCITIYGSNRRNSNNKRDYNRVMRPLKEDNPMYNPDKPNKKYPHLAEFTKHSYRVQINVWCNDERQREIIVNQVKDCLFKAHNNHYSYCSKFNDDKTCETTGETCAALTDTGYKGIMGLCPNPCKYHCCSLMNSYGVVKNSVQIGGDYEQDENDHRPPLKRSIIDIELDYYDINVFDSKQSRCIKADIGVGEHFKDKLLNI